MFRKQGSLEHRAQVHVHTRTYTYVHVHTRTYTYIHVHTRTYTYIHVHTRIHTRTYTYTYTYIHVHTRTYTCTLHCEGISIIFKALEAVFSNKPKHFIINFVFFVRGWIVIVGISLSRIMSVVCYTRDVSCNYYCTYIYMYVEGKRTLRLHTCMQK